MNDEEWCNEMHMIVEYAYGEDWIDSTSQHLWENRYNDVAKGHNALTGWLAVNEPEVWQTLKPLTIEWAKALLCDDMETFNQGFEEYKNEVMEHE